MLLESKKKILRSTHKTSIMYRHESTCKCQTRAWLAFSNIHLNLDFGTLSRELWRKDLVTDRCLTFISSFCAFLCPQNAFTFYSDKTSMTRYDIYVQLSFLLNLCLFQWQASGADHWHLWHLWKLWHFWQLRISTIILTWQLRATLDQFVQCFIFNLCLFQWPAPGAEH